MNTCRGLSLLSGGLDSQLAVRVLQRAGAHVECVTFSTPFFSPAAAQKAAAALGVPLHVVDFTDDEVALIENPPHGFGGAMNPCIDCHATMIRRAGELMRAKGFDFVATGEVLGQRPMSQNRQARGIVDYPSPAGGCKLTEEGFGRKLKDLLEHEGLRTRRLVELLAVGRHFRLPDGSALIVGRDRGENNALRAAAPALGEIVSSAPYKGPEALMPGGAKSDADRALAQRIVHSYCRDAGVPREPYRAYLVC